MATLHDLLAESELSPAEQEWIRVLTGEWQLIADLSFADLVLWLPQGQGEEREWQAAAHVRPTTGQLVFYTDQVGSAPAGPVASLVDQASETAAIVRAASTTYVRDVPVREEAIPVVRQGHVLAVLTRHTNLMGRRIPSRLEVTYQSLADSLVRMVAAGEFPHVSAPTGQRRGAPRVGDGVVHLDAGGTVLYASPNAVSALYRLGHEGAVTGELLARIVADTIKGEATVDESLAVVATGRAPWRAEVSNRGASMSMRAIPLTEKRARVGALLLLRDTSELRRRERELITKDATIREIHHRVKNNLQTVAALLRLQARRLDDAGGKEALEQAVRRVGVIALVHETLSQGFDESVEFDEIAAKGFKAIVEVASGEQHIHSTLKGSFGRLRAEDATAMAMVISELVQNAVEHGLANTGGSVTVEVEPVDDEDDRVLRVRVTDDGEGLPEGFSPGRSGLGTQIVQSLVSDLRGRITWSPAEPHGTVAEFTARLRPLTREG
ncbi:MAG: sensor histidine kinase [Micrococcales bacterium]|nr:sensor histidine kinase [Micrococcales bacterium]